MKKSLIALAVLAASGAALAQSSVTVYGRLDASVGSADVGRVAGAAGALPLATSTTGMFNSALTSSRLGFRGVEDLGGGLKAIFAIETGFAVDAPSATTLGDRAAFVGLSGGFGTVKLGRHDTSFDDIRDLMVSSNLWDSTNFASTETIVGAGAITGSQAWAGVGGGNGTTNGLADYGDRASNLIRYESPSFSGVTFGVSYGFDEDAAVKQDLSAYNVRYKAGKLDVGAAYQETKNVRKYSTVAAAYDFGGFRVSGGWNQAKQDVANGVKSNSYTVGANVPVGALDFSIGYSTAKAKNSNGSTFEKGDAFSAGVVYNMSKRTRLYGLLTNGDIENGAGVKQRQRDIYAVGVAHVF